LYLGEKVSLGKHFFILQTPEAHAAAWETLKVRLQYLSIYFPFSIIIFLYQKPAISP
jgi:hypothetical protein